MVSTGWDGAAQESRLRRLAIATAAVAGAAVIQVVGVSPASATSYDPIYSSQEKTYSTWFLGRTTICVDNPTSNSWWVTMFSGPYFSWYDYVAPHTDRCVTRSFVGLGVDVYVHDQNDTAPVGDHLYVHRPIGP